MKNRSFSALLLSGLLLAAATLALTACGGPDLYPLPTSNYSGRPIPPSDLLQRVLAAYTVNGSQGGLEILDGNRNLRSNVQNTIPAFFIAGFSSADPVSIINFPEETTGYVVSYTDGNLISVNYSTERTNGTSANFDPEPPSAAAASNGSIFAGAAESAGTLVVTAGGATYDLDLPNVDKVVINQGATVILAMVRNSNALYRVVKLVATPNPVTPPGAVDCEPRQVPVLCVVPVGNTSSAGVAGAAYDHPVDAYFSLDGNSVDILNCGPECGGTTAGVTVLQEGSLVITNVPTVDPLSATAPSPLLSIPVANPIAVPGGVTAAISDGTTLYLSGQQLQSSGLFAGNLTLLNLASYTPAGEYSISDGTHTKMLFADDDTLWIGSSQCASGPRAALAAAGGTTQAANDGCLTRFVPNSTAAGGSNAILPAWAANTAYAAGQQISDGTNIEVVLTGGTSGGSAPTWNTTLDKATTDAGVVWVDIGPVTPVQIIPAVTPNNPYTAVTASNPIDTNLTVPYPNTNLDNDYYGSLTGICWVQNFHKVYTAYGGQIHAFNTVDGSEINNSLITIQGTVLDVAYMDALTNSAD